MNYAANIPDFVKWGIFANYATQRPNFAAAAHDRSCGPEEPCRHVRDPFAIGGKADTSRTSAIRRC